MRRSIGYAMAFLLVGLICTGSANDDQKDAKRQSEEQTPNTQRVIEIVGCSVKNHKDETLGSINELVINMEDGSISYAALSCGGFLGVGDKLFAVPMTSFKPVQTKDSQCFMTKLEKESFQKAKGIDQKHWPASPDPRWSESATAKTSKDKASSVKQDAQILRCSAINGSTVYNLQGEQVGTVAGMMVDLKENKVNYVALSTGGFLGIQDKMNAVPFNALKLKYNQDGEKYFLFNVTKDSLTNAPGFDQNNWPDTANPTWARDVDEYYSSTKKRS